MAPFLKLQHISVARGETVVLHDINLAVEAGECIAILGPNGCGKSTLLKTITCECYPIPGQESSVEIFGRSRWELTELKKRLGVVEPNLPGSATLRATGLEAVLTGFFSSSRIWPNLDVTAAMSRRADEVLELIDARSLATVLVGTMSAGQQRRIMIGRALVGSAESVDAQAGAGPGRRQMLLLDEPSNALDLAAQRELRLLLRTLTQAGTGLILITHHLPDILPEIERVLLMSQGRIVADGGKSALLTSARLSELFGVPIEVKLRDGIYDAS